MLLVVILMIILLLIHLAAVDGSTPMALISKSSVHHVSLGHLSAAKNMSLVVIHYYIILLYHCDPIKLIIVPFALVLTHMLLWMAMELLALHYMTA